MKDKLPAIRPPFSSGSIIISADFPFFTSSPVSVDLPPSKRRKKTTRPPPHGPTGLNKTVDRLLDLNEVMYLTSFGKSYISEAIRAKTFPAGRKFGSSRRATRRWPESAILAWIEEQLLQSKD